MKLRRLTPLIAIILSLVFAVSLTGCGEITKEKYSSYAKSAMLNYYENYLDYDTCKDLQVSFTDTDSTYETAIGYYRDKEGGKLKQSQFELNRATTKLVQTVTVKRIDGDLFVRIIVDETTTNTTNSILPDDTIYNEETITEITTRYDFGVYDGEYYVRKQYSEFKVEEEQKNLDYSYSYYSPFIDQTAYKQALTEVLKELCKDVLEDTVINAYTSSLSYGDKEKFAKNGKKVSSVVDIYKVETSNYTPCQQINFSIETIFTKTLPVEIYGLYALENKLENGNINYDQNSVTLNYADKCKLETLKSPSFGCQETYVSCVDVIRAISMDFSIF